MDCAGPTSNLYRCENCDNYVCPNCRVLLFEQVFCKACGALQDKVTARR